VSEILAGPVPRIGLSVDDACVALAIDRATWNEHVEPDLGVVAVGDRVIVPVAKLARWLDDHSAPDSYMPCRGCGKPIHPNLHRPSAPERGQCVKCR
jgi:hypothetical protein